MSTSTTTPPLTDSPDAFAQRILDAVLGAMDALAIHLGDRLGWYRSLAEDGPASPVELAERTGTDARYAREWLEQQAVTGILGVDEDGRFSLSPVGVAVLADPHSLAYSTPMARMVCGAAMHLPELLEAYRTGGGVSWSRLGRDARESQADANRPWFEHRLEGALRSVPELDAVLRKPGARLLDIGCGAVWSTIALAHACPGGHVDGVDVDLASVELARTNVESDDAVAQRITVIESDAADLPEATYDAAFAFECIHDMPQPVEVLDAVRRTLAPGAPLIVVDEAVAETFTAPGDDVERLIVRMRLGEVVFEIFENFGHNLPELSYAPCG
ncbi:class I SAM-dependent methyltransferase [Rhodococcus sp. Z13]